MAKKNKKHSFILEMGVYMLFFFLFSILFNLFGYNENTYESNLSILVYYFVLNLCTIVAVTLVMGFIANRKKENNCHLYLCYLFVCLRLLKPMWLC